MTLDLGKRTVSWVLAAALAAVGLLLSGGCSDATKPDGGDGGGGDETAISFRPSGRDQGLTLAETLEFSISAPDAENVAVNWWRDGNVISNAEVYTYVPSAVGVDTLRVQVEADGTHESYYWLVDVESTPSTLPGAVPLIRAGPGPAPGDVAVSWGRVTNSTHRIDEYIVVVSYDGPITPGNWDQAREVGRTLHLVNQVGYEQVFTAADDGMIPGDQAWFTVRAVDVLGQMSPVSTNSFTEITTEWWLNGVVSDDVGLTHAGIIVESLQPQISTNTDNSGVFRLGPFRSIDEVVIKTISSNAPISGWYDFQSTAIDSVTGRDYELVLITRHQLAQQCTNHDGQFLKYLRYMAKTEVDGSDPDNPKLRRWESYPLQVYLPAYTSGDGVDFDDLGRFATDFWNTVMGEDYFVETADPASAQVIFQYAENPNGPYGQIRLLEPAGAANVLGNVVPEKMEVYLNPVIDQVKFGREVALHELGHVLGLLSHAVCANADYLMIAGGGGDLDNPSPIHIDEQRAVRCIRHLPQGVDTGSYSLAK